MTEDHHAALHDEIIALLSAYRHFNVAPEDLHLPMQAIHKVTPELPPLLLKYLSTGTDMARYATAFKLHELLLGINANQLSTPKTWQTHEDVYRELTSDHEDLTITMQMTAIWNYNNVASELGMNRDDTDKHTYGTTYRLQHFTPDEEASDTYWCGVFALKVACGDRFPDVDEHLDFVMEAGRSSDLATLLPIAQERYILSIPELRTILDKQQPIATIIRQGVL